jgi:hypothetical protein
MIQQATSHARKVGASRSGVIKLKKGLNQHEAVVASLIVHADFGLYGQLPRALSYGLR